MLELVAISPFAELLRPVGSGGGVTVSDRDGLGLATLQSGAALTDLPTSPRRAVVGDTAFIGTGPGRWLAIREGAANGLAGDLRGRFGARVAVNDQSDGYAVLRLTGPKLHATLEKGVPIDLHPDVFPVGAAATTMIAHVGVILWRLDDAEGGPVFEIALFRSMAGSFVHWLEASAGEFGLSVTP